MAKYLTDSEKYYNPKPKEKYLVETDREKNSGSAAEYLGKSAAYGFSGIFLGTRNFVKGGLSSLFGGDSGNKYAQYLFENDETSKLTEKLNESYNPGTIMKAGGEIAQSIGQSSVFYLNKLSKGTPVNIGSMLFFTGVAGNSISEAVAKTGKLGWSEYGYGIFSSAAETAAEEIVGAAGAGLGKAGKTVVGGLEKILGKAGKETAKLAVRNGVAKSVISAASGEFFEEFLGAYADVALQKLFGIDPNASVTLGDALYAGLIGAASGGLMEGTQTAVRATFSHTQGSKIIAEGKADALVSTVKTMQEQVKSKDWSKYFKSEEKGDVRGIINNLVAAYQAYENLPADKKTGDYAKVYLGEMQSNLAILEAMIGRSNIESDIAANAEKYVRYANQIRGKEFTAEDIKSNKDGILTQLALARWAFQFNDVETVGQHKRRWVAQQIEQQKRRGIDISEGTNAAEGGSQSILNRAGVTDSGIEWSENDDGGALTRIYHLGKDRMVVATEYGDGEWVMAAGTGDTLLADDGENVATRVKTAELDKVVTEIRDNYDAIVEKATAEREKKAEAPEENSGSEKELRQKAPKTGKPISGADNVMYATEGDLKDARLDPGKLVKSKLSIKQKATITLLSKYLEAGGYKVLLFEGNGRGANGAYRGNTIYLDINAKILRVAAHELVHSFKAKSPDMYTRIRDFIVEKEFDNDQAKLDQAIEDITKLYAENGEELKPEVAEEEIIAKSCEKVFGSVEALRSMFDTDKELFHSANAFLGTMQAFFRSIIDSYGATNEYAAAMEKSAEDLEELRARFAEAMQASLKADQKPRNAEESKVFKSINRDDALGEVYRNGDGEMTVAENVDEDKVFYSFETYDNGGREKLAQVLKDHGYSKAEVKAAMEPIEHMTEVLRRLADKFEVSYGALKNNLYATVATDITGTRQILSTLVSNGEYPVNLDLQLICKKRVAYMELMARLLEDGVFGQVKYDGDAIAMINEILSMNGYETACLGCFVESRRQMLQKWAETIVQEWNDEVKKRNPDATYFPFAVDSGKTISEEEMVRVESELSQLEKNDLGNVKLGADKVKDKMGELLDKAPSLGHLLTADTILTPDGLKALQATAGGKTLVSLVKQRYGTASPKLVQEFNPYNSELADLTFENAKKITGNSVTGAGEYMKKAKEVLGKKPAKRKSESDAQYKERVSKWEREVNEWAVQQYLFDIGGARIQSFSDFMIENVFDYFQIMGDLAAKGFPIHGYTKEIVCARLFGQTGAKWNGSLIATLSKNKDTPAGLISEEEYESWKKDGKIPEGLECIKVTGRDGKTWYVGFDDFARNKATKGSAKQTFIQSIGMKDIMSLILDPRYSKSVGNITIGVSDEQIIAMLRSPYFRMVIPYHLSGMGKDFAIRTGVDAYTDYTAYQNTRIGQLYDKKGNPVDSLGLSANDLKKQIESFNFNARLRDLGDARAVADEYIAWCRQRHEIRDGKKLLGYSEYLPKFSGSEDGKYYDFTQEENYYKLLEDFNVYDAVDELKGIRTPAPQEAVKMIFPGDRGRNLTKKELDAYRTRLKKVGIFTDADIDKIIERANWTTEQIIEHELEGRAAYKANADKMWEPTVNLIETALLTKKRLDQFKTVDEFEEMASSKSDNVKQKMLTIRPVNGTYRVEDTLRKSFVGESADVDKSPLQRAMAMEKDKENYYDPGEIRDATGWFRGADGKWRFEISDKDASLNEDVIKEKRERADYLLKTRKITKAEVQEWGNKFRLGEFLNHDKLFAAYPQLRDVEVELKTLSGTTRGEFNPDRKTIALSESLTSEEKLSTLLHEIQHAIQDIEKFARGSNFWDWKQNAVQYGLRHVNAELDKYVKRAIKEIREITRSDSFAAEQYWQMLLKHGALLSDEDYELYLKDDKEAVKKIRERLDSTPAERKIWDIQTLRRAQRDVQKLAEEHGWEEQLRAIEREAKLRSRDKQMYMEALQPLYSRDAFELYQNTAGEVEARDVQARAQFDDETRKWVVPETISPRTRRNMVFAGDADAMDLAYARYSISEDSDGDKLSDEQVAFFANSKIRDEDGKLIKVYHGTDADFTVFDETKGRSTMDIQGMFFSPWELDASGYGPNVRAFYLNIKNPAPETVAYRALNRFKGQNEAGKKAREALIRMGYDGVNNSDEEYIAFYPEQIKLVDNKTPTQDKDVRYSFEELDKEYDEAVKSGNKYQQERLVRDAARKAGYDTPMLFHGTPRFGFTTFDPYLYSPQSPYIYTSSKSNVSANYAGDNHYAARRDIGRKYRTGDSLSDIIANAETIWGKKYHEATEAERKAKYDQVIKEGAKAADKIDELYVDIDYPNESVMNAAAWIENLMFSARDYDNYFEAESDEERNVIRENWASDIRNFAESVPVLKEWYEEHRKDLTPEQRKYVAYLLSYDVGDAAIDLEYSLQRAISDGRILAGEDGSLANADELKGSMDEIHNIGSYQLYGNLGENPFEFDANGGQFWALKVPEMGEGYHGTDAVCKWAKENGYTSVIMRNIYDYGEKADNYVFFEPSQLKSADNITYDDDGNVIPLSERFNTENDDIRYSYDFSKSFAEQIEDLANNDGIINPRDALVIGPTPKVYQDIGLLPLPMTYSQKHAKDALINADGDHLGKELLKKVPDALENPIAIIDSESNPGRLVAIIELPGDSHKVLAAVDVNGQGKVNSIRINSNYVVSVHSRKNAISNLLKNAVESESNGNGGIYYWDKKKAIQVARKSGVQFPGGSQIPDGIVRIIHDSQSKVKSKLKSIFESKQFKAWFGRSKVKNTDGTPKLMYHGTAADFEAFDRSRIGQFHNDSAYWDDKAGKFVDVGDEHFWFTADESLAKDHADGAAEESGGEAKVLSGYLRVNHPLIITMDEWYASRKHWTAQDWYDKNRKQILDEYHAGNYDGIIINNPINDADEMVGIENPNQFKSDDNIGTYDSDNEKFRYDITLETPSATDGKTEGYTAAEQDEARDYVSNFDAYDPDTRISVLEFLRSAKGTKADKKILRTISNIIVASNDLDVRFADTEEKGVYVRGESGQQLILLDSKLESAAAIRKTLSAEMIHMAEQNAEGYDKFAKIVLAMTPPEEKEKIEKKYRDYWESVGREISDEALLHECVSELGADLIQDYDLVSRWANRDRSFVTRLLSAARSLARSLFGKDKDAYRQAAQMTAMLADALTGRAASNEGPVIRYQLGDKKTKPVSEREKLQDQARAIHYFTMPRSRQLINEWVDTLIKPYFTEGSGSPYVPTIAPRDLSLKKLNIPTGTALRVRGLDGIVKALYVDFYTTETTREAKKAAEFIADSILNKTYLGDTDISVNDAVKSKDTALAVGIRSALKDKVYEALTGGEAESAVDSIRVRYENLMKGVEAEAKRRESELERQIGDAKGVMKATLQAIEQINRARKQYKDGYYRYQGTLAAPEIKLLTDAVIAAKSRGGYLIPESTRKALIAFNDVFRIEQLRADLNEEYEVMGMNVETIKDLDYTVNQMVKGYDVKDEPDMQKPLTAAEIETFADVARATAQLYRTYNKYWDEKRKTWIDADETAKRGIDIVEATQKLREADPKVIKKMREVMDKYGIEALDPLAVSRLLDGYDDDGVMTEIITEVMNAENAKTLRIQKYMREVDDFIKSTKGFEKHLTSEEDMIEYRGEKLTRDEFIQLYMTTFRKQALLHLGLGRLEFGSVGSKYGLRIIAPYIQAAEAATGSTEKVEAPTIEELQNESEKVVREIRALGEKVLTPEDRKYIELMEKFYNTVSTNDKRETDYKYFGMTNVGDDAGDKYVPIVTSSSSRASSITDERTAMLDFATLSGQSFNKNTVRGAKNPLSITGAYGLMQKHANGLAAYVELYAAMQKLDRIWSTDINHDRQNSKRLRDVLKNAYGENVEKYVRNLMGDIQGINAKRPSAFNAIINRMRSNYAIFQLGANPKTWFNQLGSMGALYRFCDLDSITKGLIPTNLDKMAEYSTAAAIREGSDVAVKAQTLTSQVSGKVKDVLMKPIGWADMKIVGASWGACQYQVQKDTGYAVGSEENLKAAGQLLNKVINESQDTSLASTKTGIARSDNELIRSLAMFRSAPFKQYSRMTDAIGTLSILSAKKKAGQTVSDERMAAAKKELARTGAGWALQAAIGVAISLLFNWLYDKDKEVTAKDVALDYSSELISVIPLVGDLYNYIVSGYDLSYFAFDMLNDGLASMQNTAKVVGRGISGDNVSRQDIAKMLDKDATVIGQFTGMPTRNVKNALVGLTKRLSSIFGGSLGYRLDAARYSQSYQSDLQKALEDGNDRLAETIVELLYSDKKATSEASGAVVSEVVRLYGEGYKNVLPPTVSSTVTVDGVEYDMTAKDQKRIRSIANGADRVITGMISTDTYKGLDDADRAKAIGKIYDVYYDRALNEVFGVPMTKADAISRLGDEAVIFSAAAHVANIESDKDANGKTITNSRKNKVNDYLKSLGLDLDTLSLILYASGYSSEALKKQVGTVAATANLDADTYADVYGALNLASA